jgi:hypothetical protein
MDHLHHGTRCYFVSLASSHGRSSNGRKTPSTHCYCELSKVNFPWYFFKTFNRVGTILSSNVDSCRFRTVRIFNIIRLHFEERCGTKLATLHCNVGSLACGPGHSSNGRMTMLARCYSNRRPLLCDVIGAHCFVM